MANIEDKVFWITGGSSGIGAGLVYELAQRNIKMIISSRRAESLEQVRSACPAAAQANIKILTLDLSRPELLHDKATEALAIFGRVDILVHSGGISQRSMVVDTDIEVYRQLMEVDFFSTVILTKAILPAMIQNGYGHIVPISSLVGKFGSPYRSGYAAAKHALHGFYDSLRAENYKKNIWVTIITPGFVHTNVSINALTQDGSKLNKMDEAQQKGMSPATCARKIIKAVEQRKNEALMGGKETLAVYLQRFLPNVFARIIRTVKVR
jgi:short-subunit dehydrogenase